MLLPASTANVNLCKTILSASILGYPIPILIAWNETFQTGGLLGGGSHLAKISRVLEYLHSMPPEADHDLVMMMDAFDIWFQLRPETMILRYNAINDAENIRIRKRLGKVATVEDIKQTIVFGAGKRCAPNEMHTIACYAIPLSPLPNDIYGQDTDTVMGRNKYTSLRQRFLNSGYIIGPVADMRRMFERAAQKMQDWPKPYADDNGSHDTDDIYHGSDQAIFAILFGEQELQREVIRRRYEQTSKPPHSKDSKMINEIEGTFVGDDILNPPFSHEHMDPLPGKPCEFGMGLDYFSDLGHQTANAEHDGQWAVYNQSSDEFRNKTNEGRQLFDCEYRGSGQLPADIVRTPGPFANLTATDAFPADQSWNETSLYTNLCLDRVPVMVHHNGDKSARESTWSEMWFQQYGKSYIDASVGSDNQPGALVPNGEFLKWDDLCPPEDSTELFRR